MSEQVFLRHENRPAPGVVEHEVCGSGDALSTPVLGYLRDIPEGGYYFRLPDSDECEERVYPSKRVALIELSERLL